MKTVWEAVIEQAVEPEIVRIEDDETGEVWEGWPWDMPVYWESRLIWPRYSDAETRDDGLLCLAV